MSTPTSNAAAAPSRDAQGGRFHLLAGRADWMHCAELVPDGAGTLVPFESDRDGRRSSLEWHGPTGSLRLAHREAVSRHRAVGDVRPIGDRRGADRDRYGSWYRIGDDERSITRSTPTAAGVPPSPAATWWSLDRPVDCTVARAEHAAHRFASNAEPQLRWPDARLAGLAITTGHRLLVGLVDEPGGLLMFDLYAGGSPTELRLPGGHALTVFDIAATDAGGVVVLDRVRRTWWRLDQSLRLLADVQPGADHVFEPAVDGAEGGGGPTGGDAARGDSVVSPLGNTLGANGADAVIDPVAIVDVGGTVLVLDRPPNGASAVVVCDPSAETGVAARLPLTVEALDPARPDLPAFVHELTGHDMAWGGDGTSLPLAGPLLYVADAATSGVEAYTVTFDPPSLTHRPEELPMRAWDAKALVATGGDVFYDAVGRWIPLEPFGVCNSARSAIVRTPTGFGAGSVPGQPFDSRIRGCVWHRCFVDAGIPSGCTVTIAARAADDAQLLERLPFVDQPVPYLRPGGSELPWHDPWLDHERPAAPNTGTWELLFQHVRGRYLQLEISITGTGRSTPTVRAVRAWFPRFSYVEHYLPEIYQIDDRPDHLLERLLANVEGVLIEHESRIENAWMLADPRTTPPAALDWLASWVGLQLEPAWTVARRRFLLEHIDRMYRCRGTIGGLRALLRTYLGCSLDPDVVFAPQARADDPARIVDRVGTHRFRVLVPARLDGERHDMVARIVDAARPAHTAYELRVTSGLLTVGEAQLGLDTIVGDSVRFEPHVLDATDLAAGVVAADHPFDVDDRVVSDRDRLGNLPPI